MIAEIVAAEPEESWIIWCDTDYEADELTARIPEAVEVRGSDPSDYKEAAAMWFCGIEGECTCGSRNTQKRAERNTMKTQRRGSGEKAKAELQSKTWSTCADTTQKTKKNGTGQQSNETIATSPEDANTLSPKSCESAAEAKSENGSKITQTSDSLKDSSHSGSPQMSTEQCTSHKEGYAQSAAEKAKTGDCESIIVIQQDESGVCYATHAISDSESSAIRQSLSKKRCNTCELQSRRSRILITKPSIFGFGLNFQHCARVAFAGISFSYESYYQAIRRCWRFGQQREVFAHIAVAETEGVIWNTLKRKAAEHDSMKRAMHEAMRRAVIEREVKVAYRPVQSARMPSWLRGAA
jgi:hypothetical protein